MAKFTVCAISGSLRAGSFNTAALRAAAELAPEGVAVVAQSIAEIPLYNEDVKAAGFPPAVIRLQEAIAAADAVLIATPEYNYSVPGVLKNAIDWVSRTTPQPFADKPVAIMGASPGALGTSRAQYDLRKMFVYLDAHLLNKPEIMIGGAASRFDADGRLTDEATSRLLQTLMRALRDWADRLRTRP